MKESTLQVEISGQTTENITPDEAIRTLLLSSLEANWDRFSRATIDRALFAASLEIELDHDGYSHNYTIYHEGHERDGHDGYTSLYDAECAADERALEIIVAEVEDDDLDIEKVWAAIMNVEA